MGIRRPNRQIEVFDISLMAVVTKAMGAFLVIMLLLMPYYRSYPAYQVPASNLSGQLKDLENQIAQLRNQPGANTPALDAANQKLQQAQDQLTKLTDQMNMAWSQTQQAQSQLAQTQQQLQQAEAQTQAVQSQLQQAQNQMQTASSQNSALGSTLNDAVPKQKLLIEIIYQFSPACKNLASIAYNLDLIAQDGNVTYQAVLDKSPDFAKQLNTVNSYTGVFYPAGNDLTSSNVESQIVISSPFARRRIFFTAAANAGQKMPANCTISASITDLLGAAGTSSSLNNMALLTDRPTLFAIADMAPTKPKIYFGSEISDADVARYNQNQKCIAEFDANKGKTANLAPQPDCNGTPYPPPDASSSSGQAD
jgi:hypothetical protein